MIAQTMTDAAKEARRAYKRKWAKEHPENVKESQRRYWEKRAAAMGKGQTDNSPEKPHSVKGI